MFWTRTLLKKRVDCAHGFDVRIVDTNHHPKYSIKCMLIVLLGSHVSNVDSKLQPKHFSRDNETGHESDMVSCN